MVSSRTAYLALVGLTYAARLLELRVSARNARTLRAAGAIESAPGHYRAMVAFHALFPAACALEVVALRRPFPGAVGALALAALLGAHALRAWCMRTLRGRWTTRILVPAGVPPVTGGPYRWLPHPNYAAVVVEVAALPLVHGAWIAALAGSAANAALLAVRIRAEERALGAPWRAAFARRPRPVPRGGA